MMTEKQEIDYYGENYPYHVEMVSRYLVSEDKIILFYENGKSSEFSISCLGLSPDILTKRLQNTEGNIVYVYKDHSKSRDIAVELYDITGCCSGTRKLLMECLSP